MLVSGRDPRIPYELDEGYVVTFGRLCRQFRARGVHHDEASDLAQEAIARALLHIRRNGCNPSFDGVGPLLKRIATNLLIDRARAAKLRIVSIDDQDVEEFEADPSRQVERRVDEAELRAAIATLSSRHRRAMMMSLNGSSPAEIAADFGIERNAADALLHRARKRLADRLRHSGHAIRVLVVLLGLRIREGARRASAFAEAGVSAPLSINVAAAAFATALALGGPAVATTRHDVPAPQVSSGAAVRGATHVEARHRSVHQPDAGSSLVSRPRASADVDADDHKVSVGGSTENPATGEEEDVLAEAWHEREEQNRGLTGPVLDDITGTACSTGAAAGC